MPKQVTLALDFPSVPKGSVLTQDTDGRYYNEDRSYWIDAEPVESKESIFIPGVIAEEEIPNEIILYAVNGNGTVSEIKTGDTALPVEALPVNVFIEKAKAEEVAVALLEILNVAKK